MRLRSIATALALGSVLAAPLVLLGDNTHAKGAKPLHISHGQEVNLADYLVPGKTTVFDFYSEYCGPCMAIDHWLDMLHASNPEIAVVMVDINRPDIQGIDWRSPVAREFSLMSVPQFKVYGPDGKLRAEGLPAREMVLDWLQ